MTSACLRTSSTLRAIGLVILGVAGVITAGVSAVTTADAGRASAASAPELSRVNEALAAWLDLMDADRPFLVLDGSTGVIRLHQGNALLRVDTVAAADPGPAAVQRLQARLRRYARADPFHEIEPGPFDWEHALVSAADDDSALLFDGGLLVYADAAWEPARPPSLRLPPAGLRALYDALGSDTAVVILPAGWDSLAPGATP